MGKAVPWFLLALLVFFAPGFEARGQEEERQPPRTEFPADGRIYLKTDVLPIAEVLFFVFRFRNSQTLFMAPHTSVAASWDFSGKDIEELIGALEKSSKLRIREVFGRDIFLAAPPKEFDVIKTLAESNLDVVSKTGFLPDEYCPKKFGNVNIIQGGAFMSAIAQCVTRADHRVVLAQVPEGEIGYIGNWTKLAQGLSLAAAILGCQIYHSEGKDILDVAPADSSRVLDMIPVAEPIPTDEPIRVLATIGDCGDARALIQFERIWNVLGEKQSVDGNWRIQKIRNGTVEMIEERSGQVKTFSVP
ncbi:MAG: hypothetical protein WA705_26815 [Candidatus Ozemobacteraceae bacterium]